MKVYTGTKTIKAEPMTLGEYNLFRGWDLPSDEDPATEGYFVVYPNAKGEFNGPLVAGSSHMSWSPKDVFEAVYKETPEYAD